MFPYFFLQMFPLQLGSRRCMTRSECQNRPRAIDGNKNIPFPYIPFRDDRNSKLGKCILDCPSGYFERMDCADADEKDQKSCRRRCEKCQGVCEKHCQGAVIDSISTARSFKECTVIEGALEISIRNQGGCKYFFLIF